jgi:hypothetical protein
MKGVTRKKRKGNGERRGGGAGWKGPKQKQKRPLTLRAADFDLARGSSNTKSRPTFKNSSPRFVRKIALLSDCLRFMKSTLEMSSLRISITIWRFV